MGLGHEILAVARSSAGACTSSSTASPKPPRSFIPMPTDADTSVPVTSSLSRPATTLMAEWKHAANPAANSCSGLVAPPDPPSSWGTRRSTSRIPSSEVA